MCAILSVSGWCGLALFRAALCGPGPVRGCYGPGRLCAALVRSCTACVRGCSLCTDTVRGVAVLVRGVAWLYLAGCSWRGCASWALCGWWCLASWEFAAYAPSRSEFLRGRCGSGVKGGAGGSCYSLPACSVVWAVLGITIRKERF